MKYINTATGKDYQLFLLLKNIAVISKNRVVDIYYSYTYSKTRGGETVKKIVHTLLDYSHPVKKQLKRDVLRPRFRQPPLTIVFYPNQPQMVHLFLAVKQSPR
jgi:hypothetical protein